MKDIIIVHESFEPFFTQHFVHAMQYYFYIFSILYKNNNKPIYIIGKHDSKYCKDFIDSIANIINSKIKILDKNLKEIKNNHKEYNITILDRKKLNDWFISKTAANFLRDNLIKKQNIRNNVRIGIINRTHNNAKGNHIEGNRILLNDLDLKKSIKENFNIDTQLVNFDNFSFNQQINFCYNHDIIISPHGAQLASVPFMPDYSLVIEITHKDYYLDYYFKKLAINSGKSHMLECETHDENFLNKWKNYDDKCSHRQKCRNQNINVNIDKIIKNINFFIDWRKEKITNKDKDHLLNLKI